MNTLDFGFWFLIPSKMCFRPFMEQRPCKRCFAIFGSLTCSSWNRLRLTRNRLQAGGGARLFASCVQVRVEAGPHLLTHYRQSQSATVDGQSPSSHLIMTLTPIYTQWMRFNPLPTGNNCGFRFINLGFPKIHRKVGSIRLDHPVRGMSCLN